MAEPEPAEPLAPAALAAIDRSTRSRRFPLRAWLRACHRDVGYVLVGLTVVYALSGLAINHIGQDWNPNYTEYEREHELGGPLPTDRDAATAQVLARLGIDETPARTEAVASLLDIELANRTLHVDLDTGHVFEEGREPRFFLTVANWLHYNRGKRAWTYIADGYAVLLLFLACSGMFMLKGRKGLIGRGGILVLLGASVPFLYVHFSGGP
jgi:hypothetical protein